jgi:hypothetical protein
VFQVMTVIYDCKMCTTLTTGLAFARPTKTNLRASTQGSCTPTSARLPGTDVKKL